MTEATHPGPGARESLTTKLALLCASTVVALILAEVALRAFAPQIFPIHPPGMYREDPQVGYILTPGFSGVLERPEFRHQVSVGPEGLRGPGVRPRSPETFRVLVLGDSQAFGFGVVESATLTTRLERLLKDRFPDKDIQVLNAGVPGYGTADELAFLRSRGPALRPDFVVVQFLSVNDLQESMTPARTWAIVTEEGMLGHRDAVDPERRPWHRRLLWWLKWHSHVVSLASNTMSYLMIRTGLVGQGGTMWGEDIPPEMAELGSRLLVEIAATARDLGARTLFLYTTGQASVLQPEYDSLPSRNVVRAAAERAGVPWIDVTAAMRRVEDRDALYFPRNGHWTEAGHRVVAEILAPVIAEQIESAPLRTDGEARAPDSFR